jgi:putative ABC transport system substrate-binding protein
MKKVAALSLLIAVALVAFAVIAQAQQPKKIPRIGYLAGSAATGSTGIELIRLALRERGYIEGQNIAIEYRYAEGKRDNFLRLLPSWCVSRLISSW